MKTDQYCIETSRDKRTLFPFGCPSNIIIDTNGNIKIIDFGFGKKLSSIKEAAGSIFLNWPVSEQPLEIINQHIYSTV